MVEVVKRKLVKLPNNWEPRYDQMPLWTYMENGGTRAVEVAHRRWGKDDVALHLTSCKTQERIGNYWHMLPQYGQARKAVWDAINPRTGKKRIDEAFPRDMRRKTREQEMAIEFLNGSMWQLVGSDNYNSIVGSPPIGLVFSEYAIANPMAWAYLSPILAENGGYAIFIYTSRGNNHGRSMFLSAKKKMNVMSNGAVDPKGWFAQRLTAYQTPVFTPETLENERQNLIDNFGEAEGQALYEQEYECSFEGAVHGSYWAKQIRDARKEGRIGKVPWQPGFEVDTFWDLGVDDSMTIWFIQKIGLQYHIIDYYENTGYGLEHYAKIMRGQTTGFEHMGKYVYGNHFMPHDARAREMTSGEIALSRKQVAENLGIKPIHVVHRAKNMDIVIHVQIPAVRNILPMCVFDAKRCEQGLNALEAFRAEWDPEKRKLHDTYVHDWSSHGSTAFITFAMGAGKTVKKYKSVMEEMGLGAYN